MVENRELWIFFFNVAWCLRSPEIDTVFEIFKSNVDELRLAEKRADEWRGESGMEARDL